MRATRAASLRPPATIRSPLALCLHVRQFSWRAIRLSNVSTKRLGALWTRIGDVRRTCSFPVAPGTDRSLRHEALQDMEFIRIELVVGEVERKDLRLDRAEARFRVVIG